MATFREYRLRANISVSELARLANVDYRTCKRADKQEGPIQLIKARALLQVLSQHLDISLSLEEIEGLEVQ